MITIPQVLMEGFLTGVIGLTVKMDSRREPEPALTLLPKGMEKNAMATWSKQGHALRKVSDSFHVAQEQRLALNTLFLYGTRNGKESCNSNS